VTCLDVVGENVGLFYPVGAATPAAIYDVIHGVYIYVTDSSAGKQLAVTFVPSGSASAPSCTPIPGVIPVSSGMATIDPTTAVAPTTPAAVPTTRGTSNNAGLSQTIVVDGRGQTLYELSPETMHHLLCTKANGCFAAWQPLTVKSAKTRLSAAPGIKGKLGILHRNRIFQITLGGHPLYRFSGDGSKAGAASGQGIRSFHGRWHVVMATATVTTPTAPTAPTTPTAPMTPGYPSGY
jgi:predicted lipoprotein with Yx(FWY)xxD motif